MKNGNSKDIKDHFKDISLSFEPHPVTKDLFRFLKNESTIRRSVRNIVETIPTERFLTLWVLKMRSSLFEIVDFGTASIIRDEILTALENFEERVENLEVIVDQSQMIHLM